MKFCNLPGLLKILRLGAFDDAFGFLQLLSNFLQFVQGTLVMLKAWAATQRWCPDKLVFRVCEGEDLLDVSNNNDDIRVVSVGSQSSLNALT